MSPVDEVQGEVVRAVGQIVEQRQARGAVDRIVTRRAAIDDDTQGATAAHLQLRRAPQQRHLLLPATVEPRLLVAAEGVRTGYPSG